MLKKFGNTSFAYDANGLRVKKGNKEYIWSGDRLLGEVVNGDTIRYYYDASGIAGYEYRGAKFAFRKNLQGDVIGIIDSTGTLLGTYEYDAWGNCTKVNVLVMGTSMVFSLNSIRYRGYFYDSETGLYYLQSRYYDPQTGRFISPDAYSYLQPDTVNGLNLYSYCNNNPVMNVDPSGRSFIALLIILAVGAVVGGGIGGKVAYDSGKRGWNLVGSILLGTAVGIAVAGITVAAIGAGWGALGHTMFLGMATQKVVAWGLVVYNLFGMVIAPILGIEVTLVEWGNTYNEQKPNTTPWYEKPITKIVRDNLIAVI